MALDVVAFSAEHVDAAAALLAARHRADRAREPTLPATFTRADATRPVVRATAGWRGASGVAAVRDGKVVGFLIGVTILLRPTSRDAPFLQPRSVVIPYSGHGVDPGEETDLYGTMYAALAPTWVRAGFLAHYAHVAASDRDTLDRWHALGFGGDTALALRDTAPVPGEGAAVELRRARPEELDTVVRLAFALHRHHSAPPMYLPYLPETEYDERRYHEKLLADPAAVHWLACRDGRVLGMHCLQPPPAFISPLLVPDACTYLLQAYTEPATRGIGLGTALLSRSMAWAREHGHTHCLLHFLPSNRVAARFWLGRGFRPLEHRLHRQIDPRVAWA